MHEFLSNNRDELIGRCKRKVEQRPKRAATTQQLTNGIPLFLDQLTRTLRAEEADDDAESLRISGPSGVTASVCSAWADGWPSKVTTVHLSLNVFVLSVPRLSIGSIAKQYPARMRSFVPGLP